MTIFGQSIRETLCGFESSNLVQDPQDAVFKGSQEVADTQRFQTLSKFANEWLALPSLKS